MHIVLYHRVTTISIHINVGKNVGKYKKAVYAPPKFVIFLENFKFSKIHIQPFWISKNPRQFLEKPSQKSPNWLEILVKIRSFF